MGQSDFQSVLVLEDLQRKASSQLFVPIGWVPAPKPAIALDSLIPRTTPRQLQLSAHSQSVSTAFAASKEQTCQGLRLVREVNRLLLATLLAVSALLVSSLLVSALLVPALLVSCFACHNYRCTETIERWPVSQSTHRPTLRPR